MTKSDTAAGYIRTHCPHSGSYNGDGAPFKFLSELAQEMAVAPHTDLFPDRYKEHVAYALDMVARNGFLTPPAAIGAVYLATRFEFFFRLLSGKLKSDGTWLNKAVDQRVAISALGSNRGLTRDRVSDVAVTYKLMKLNTARQAPQVLDALDKAIFPAAITAMGGTVGDIGERIAFGRHAAGHGSWGDISSEAVFYGLVTAIIFYNQN